MLFHPVEPYFHRGLQFIHSLTAKSFHIKYRWQVSTVQLYGMNKKIGLSHWICLGNKIMICSPNKTIFMCFTEVSGKTRVTMISSLGSLHKNKMNREIGLPVTCQHRPVNISLIMRNVNSMHFVTARYTYAIPLPAITRLPTISIRTDKKPIKRWVDKPGFLAGVARFFDWGDNNWGKEQITEYKTEINKEATEKNIKEYIQNIKNIYSKTIDEYYNQFSFITSQFDLALERERRSYEDKQKNLLNQKETKAVIEELDNLLNIYRKEKKHNNINNSKKEEIKKDNNTSLEEIEIDDYIYNFSLLSEYMIYSFNDEVMKSLFNHLKIYKANDIIIGWDNQSISLFIKRFFNKIIEVNNKMKNYTSAISKDSIFSLNLLYSPNEINISFNRYNNIYLMLNAQIGFSKKQINDVKLLDKLTNSNFVFLVIEDFEQLINGNGFNEMLYHALDFKEEIEKIAHCKAFILINSENPIYNLSFIEHQLKPCQNLQDEVKLISEIENEYANFINK